MSRANDRAIASSEYGRSAEPYVSSGATVRRTRSASSSSNSRLFEYWWLTGTPPTMTVSSLADRSTAMATVS